MPDKDAAPTVDHLEAALARVRGAEDFPAVSGRLHQLMELLGDEDASVQRLANFLLQDYSLTLKLLRTANSFQFNRSGAPVVSATHAIVMMGAQTVRDLVSTIVVFEHYHRKSPGLRQLLMLSLLSANHAREVAERTGGARGEEAYLLGMLRNLGEVLVACYLPAEYAAVLKDVADHRSTAEAACRRVLHFTYEQLATAVVRDWHIPYVERVLSDGGASAEKSQTIVSFAHALTSAVYRQGHSQPQQAVRLLLQKYADLKLDHDDVGAVLEAGVAGTKETFKQAKVQLDELRLKHQIALALNDKPSSEQEPAPVAPRPCPKERVATTMSVVTQAVDDAALDLNKTILVILEAALTAGGFDRAVLALVSPTRREVCGRFGLGRDCDSVVTRFRFPLSVSGGPVGIALTRGQELMIAKDWELLPDEQRLLRTMNAGAILGLPLVVEGRTIGGLYVDTDATRPPAEAAFAIARHMRDAIITAMSRRRPQARADVA
jgi:GAF domain-containing protein